MRTVRLVVPVPPGGIVDFVGRVLGQKLSEVTGQNVVVDNRPGASTIVGTELVARSLGDGYTLLANTLPLVVNPSLFPKLQFDVEKDLAPVSLVVTAPYLMVVHPSVPVRSIKELIALAKARPGVVKYSSGGNGTNLHVAAELFKNLTHTDIVHVPYRGGGPALTGVVAGEADLSVLALVAVLPQVNAGRLRALAITSRQRSPVVAQLPTVAEAGVPGFEFTSWVGVLVPATTPPRLIATLNDYIVKAMRSPGVTERFSGEGAEVVAGTPAQFGAQIKTEIARWAKVVRENQLKAD